MILIALGANLWTEKYGPPARGLNAAVEEIEGFGIHVLGRSRWYKSSPVPPATTPWFVNGVIKIKTNLEAEVLLTTLLVIEEAFGRERGHPGAARTLDLDLIDYHGQISHQSAKKNLPCLTLPHPRVAERAFVLVPLREVAPQWRHPTTGASVSNLLKQLPPDQALQPL